MQIERRAFCDPADLFRDVANKVEGVRARGKPIDFITFVPDGEPTLDAELGREVALLRSLGIPIAVITNASLLWRADVREDLMLADWVSLKIDSTRDPIWRQVDRPHGALRLSAILDGMLEFARAYQGELVTETMLIEGVNEGVDNVREVANFLSCLKPACAYLAVPTRPPAEAWVRAPGEENVVRAYHIVSEKVERAEYLIGYEGNAFASTGNPREDVLSITAVHPMREDAMRAFLQRAQADWSIIHDLLNAHRIVELEYEGHKFYARRFSESQGSLRANGP